MQAGQAMQWSKTHQVKEALHNWTFGIYAKAKASKVAVVTQQQRCSGPDAVLQGACLIPPLHDWQAPKGSFVSHCTGHGLDYKHQEGCLLRLLMPTAAEVAMQRSG